jgi:hypothetical protein
MFENYLKSCKIEGMNAISTTVLGIWRHLTGKDEKSTLIRLLDSTVGIPLSTMDITQPLSWDSNDRCIINFETDDSHLLHFFRVRNAIERSLSSTFWDVMTSVRGTGPYRPIKSGQSNVRFLMVLLARRSGICTSKLLGLNHLEFEWFARISCLSYILWSRNNCHSGLRWSLSQNSNHPIEKLFCSLEFCPLEQSFHVSEERKSFDAKSGE